MLCLYRWCWFWFEVKLPYSIKNQPCHHNKSINDCWSFYQWRRKSGSAINKTKFILCNKSLLHGSSLGVVILTSQNFRHKHSSRGLSAWWRYKGFEMSSTNTGSCSDEVDEEEFDTDAIDKASSFQGMKP